MGGSNQHILVDTERLLLTGMVHTADLSNCNAIHLTPAGGRAVPRLLHFWVDAGYIDKGVA
jgi:hypothetical protein